MLAEDGFWDSMLAFHDTTVEAGFISAARRSQLLVTRGPDDAIDQLSAASGATQQGMVW